MKAHDEGIIHVHDLGYVSGPISNCELVNLEDMLQNGTVITNTLIEGTRYRISVVTS
jgi:ribonucleoside-triphosphate reductase